MIGQLPECLEIGGKNYKIDADFRNILNIFVAFNDPELTENEKCFVCIQNLFEEPESIPHEYLQTAINRAFWFVSGGNNYENQQPKNGKIIDWEQDEFLYFSAINKVAGFEIRAVDFLHWWTFLGYFSAIGDCLLSQIIHIRDKKISGKSLEKWEQDFYNKNKNIVKIRKKWTKTELEEHEKINKIFE